MSAASPKKLRQTVEETRQNPPPGSSQNLDDMPMTPRDLDDPSSPSGDNQMHSSASNAAYDSSSPTDVPGTNQVRREETNFKVVMEFVSKITSCAAQQPKQSLEVLLDSLGYQKDVGEDSSDEDNDLSSDSKSMSSISFNFGGSSEGSSVSVLLRISTAS